MHARDSSSVEGAASVVAAKARIVGRIAYIFEVEELGSLAEMNWRR